MERRGYGAARKPKGHNAGGKISKGYGLARKPKGHKCGGKAKKMK